jgi:hypothetical protein
MGMGGGGVLTRFSPFESSLGAIVAVVTVEVDLFGIPPLEASVVP